MGAKVLTWGVKKIFPYLAAMAFVVCFVSGCKTRRERAGAPTSLALDTRNNCYSLLHQLLSDEKQVSLLRFIKHENSDLKDYTERVAWQAKEGARQLEQFAKADHSLSLEAYQLPPGEVKTRDSISAMKESELLHSKGNKLEVLLLLSQSEALTYGAHLAKVAGDNESDPERAHYLAALGARLKILRDEAVVRLNVRHDLPGNGR